MANDNDIISRVIIEGAKSAAEQVDAIGEAGREAFDALAEAAGAAADAQERVEAGLAGSRAALEALPIRSVPVLRHHRNLVAL